MGTGKWAYALDLNMCQSASITFIWYFEMWWSKHFIWKQNTILYIKIRHRRLESIDLQSIMQLIVSIYWILIFLLWNVVWNSDPIWRWFNCRHFICWRWSSWCWLIQLILIEIWIKISGLIMIWMLQIIKTLPFILFLFLFF